jgi:hypothetical protein
MLFSLGAMILFLSGILFAFSIFMMGTCIPDKLDTIMDIISWSSIILMIIGFILLGYDTLIYLGIL